MITVPAILEVWRKRPFQPFRIVLSDGIHYDIQRPEMAFLTRKDLLVGIGETKEGIALEFRICPLPPIVAIELLNDTNTASNQ